MKSVAQKIWYNMDYKYTWEEDRRKLQINMRMYNEQA